ncbi:Cytosol aminopeptidase PepA [Labilithrix luteola]|uniref:Probable cytosol aminopeptidase n=1 Tax=Labilithrix luteola TaxID=1391654 RepID=A0A0K1PUX8_9BACT|nr:leucyl aminopeptidase [Labilithrix luteola]AKU97181.1 Cytosol aminopeptidase PepA [Labilithrix luteola]
MPLKITVRSVLPSRETGDLIVVGVPSTGASKKKNDLSPLDGFDRALGGALTRLQKKEDFKGKKDQQLSLSTLGRVKADRLLVIGLGDVEKLSVADLRTFAAKAARAANADKAKRLVLGLPVGLEGRLREVAEGLELGAYRFTKYLTGDRRPKAELGQVAICLAGETPKDAKEQVDIGQTVALGVNLARDLSNEPPNEIYPDTLAAAAVTAGKEAGLKVQIFDYKEIQKRGMKLLQAVGQGSEHKPCLGHMSWVPAGAKRKIVIVGKGITFDSGGLSIKPAAGMGEMKHDMSGAANVVGLMAAVGRLKPNVEVHGIFAAAENMPDGGSYRPGDIWPSLDGKSVEIINTDAEGRLILADALAYARDLEPDLLIDNATLTGACVVALGNGCSGWYASNEDAADEFQKAIKGSGESMWRMPLLEDLKDQLKSDSADLKHTGDRWGGSISAALFLREFIGNVSNWIHCDIAGPAMGDRVRGWDPKGGTGHGVLTFLEIIEKSSDAPVTAAPVVPPSAPSVAKVAPARARASKKTTKAAAPKTVTIAKAVAPAPKSAPAKAPKKAAKTAKAVVVPEPVASKPASAVKGRKPAAKAPAAPVSKPAKAPKGRR